MSVMTIEISKIRRDGGTQSRAELNQDTVAEYTAAMHAGDSFPAVKVFYDGKDYWLADGFHRVKAASEANATVIQADVHQGTQRDAVLDSTGANSKHGLRRTQEDVRRAINTLLNDEQWVKWSDREIARRVGCDHKTVGRERAKLSGEIPQTRTVERNGTTYEMTATTKPAIVNSVGRAFEIGDIVRIAEQDSWKRDLYGKISAIDGDDIALDSVVSRSNKEQSKTLTVSRVRIFPINQMEYVYWYCHASYDVQIVLFPWKDYYVGFDVPYSIRSRGTESVSWKPLDGYSWDTAHAYRFHETYLKRWDETDVSYKVVKAEDTPDEMLDVLGRVGRARGKVNMPEELKSDSSNQPQKPEFPEWAKVGCPVRSKDNRQNAGFVESVWDGGTRWMIRVRDRRYGFTLSVTELEPCEPGFQLPQPIWNETQLQAFRQSSHHLFNFLDLRLIPDKGDFFDDLELVYQAVKAAREHYKPDPKPEPTPEPIQKTVIKAGMNVLTRTGRPGEVLDIIGGIANVKSGSYTNPHKVDTLKVKS